MRKTRFFYGKKLLLSLCLVWLALLNEAAYLNLKQKQEEVQTIKENVNEITEEKVKEEQKVQQEKDTPSPKESEKEEPHIRVLLMDSAYETYFHPYVTVVCQGEEITYTPESPELSEQPVVLEAGEEGITVTSIERQEGAPCYSGSLKIERQKEGLILVNELPLEEYLKAVVPSEMPSSYEQEALMAQAVCARTYAYKQIEEGRLKEYGADVDDSVNFQVYRNIPPSKSTTKAVLETEGEIICQNGEPIEAYYFSTSSGTTSTDEVWGAVEAASYLKSVPCTFDSQETWSAWSVEIPWSQMQTQVDAYTGENAALQDIQVTKKSQSGAVIGLLAVTEEGSIEVSSEYDIREFLSPKDCMITGKDGTEIPGQNLLPSAYFTMEVKKGESVCLKGSGYGHGVGMSQNGANEMAKEGYSYQEILNYFFKDIEIVQAQTIAG